MTPGPKRSRVTIVAAPASFNVTIQGIVDAQFPDGRQPVSVQVRKVYRKLMLITAAQTNPTSSSGLNADRRAQTMGTFHMCQAIWPRKQPQGQIRSTIGHNSVVMNITCEHVQRDRRSSGSLDDWIRRSTAKFVTPLAPSQSRSRKT